jgi:hypothetical protein
MMKIIKKWEQDFVSGGKRANIVESDYIPDWFVGYGKDHSCQFEGTWWDMICLARNILASENTKLCAPEFHKPEWENNNYIGEDMPYEFNESEFEK